MNIDKSTAAGWSQNENRDLIPVIVEREQAVRPDWCDSWGIKSVRPDLRTYHGYRWPWPGGTAECDPYEIDHQNVGACPVRIWSARTWGARACPRDGTKNEPRERSTE